MIIFTKKERNEKGVREQELLLADHRERRRQQWILIEIVIE